MLNPQDLEAAYGLIKAQAIKFYQSTGIPVDELQSQGNLLLCEALTTFDPCIGTAFSTYFYAYLRNGLCDFVKAWRRAVPTIMDAEELPDVQSHDMTEQRMMLKEHFRGMSSSGLAVIDMLFKHGLALQLLSENAPKKIRGTLKLFLQWEYGWSAKKAGRAFHEVKTAVRAL